jgi:Do/DeqQ family serine protease
MQEKRNLTRSLFLVLILGALVALSPVLVERFAYAVQKGRTTALRDQLAEMADGDRLSPLFNAVAETVQPSVVEVRTTQKIRRPNRPGNPFFRFENPDDLRRFFFGQPDGDDDNPRMPSRPQQPEYFFRRGQGSGVIVDAEGGYVLTNNHVVAGADSVEVVLADGRVFETNWIRGDERSDLAVVKIEADNLIAAPLGNSDNVEVGHWVLAIGSPMGLSQTVTAGIVSGTGRAMRLRRQMYEDYIQTDASINRGNSGGPLVNTRGEVVGINTLILSNTGMNAGIGMAIPSNMARNIMYQLIDKGRVERGFLGVVIQDITDRQLAESFNLPDTRGALVTAVQPDSAADRAGIQPEDFIVAVDGQPVDDVNDLRNRIAGKQPGTTVEMTLYRDGTKQLVPVELGALPDDLAAGERPAPEEPRQVRADAYGLSVQSLNDELRQQLGYDDTVRGVVIEEVDPQSDAAASGLRAGMVITRVNKRPIQTVSDFREAMDAAGKGVRLRVMNPRGGALYLYIMPQESQ